MEQRFSQVILRGFMVVVMLVSWFLGMGVALTPDGLALLEFKDGLTVTSPLLENWKASDASPCSWGGISCTASGEVRNISLSAQVPMLEGNLSSSLGQLKSLEALSVDNNLLSGRIPPDLGSLSSLRSLSLSANQLSEEIPPELGNCSNLVELWLRFNMLSGSIPESLGNLQNLSIVSLAFNSLSGEVPVSFAALPKLDTFDISRNSLTGSVPPMIFKNLNLKSFDVTSNTFSGDITTGLEELLKLPSIEWIGMANNSFTGSLPPLIGNDTTLGNNNSVGKIPHQLTNMTTLIYLALAKNELSGTIPPWLGNLINLTTLYLSTNNFIGEVPPELGNMASIQVFHLFGNNLNGTIPSSLGNLINAEDVQLSYNHFTGSIPISFTSLINLNTLYLSSNEFSGEIPPQLGDMMSLEELDMAYLNLNGTIPSSLGNLVNLEYIGLFGNNLTGPIPTSFASLINLKNVSLQNNSLIGPIPSGFSKMTALETIYLYGNRMSGPIPEDFGRFMPNLTIIDIPINFFNGMLPNGLCQGGKLNSLFVAGNQFEGSIPSSLARCTSLTFCTLYYNRFTSIPNGFGSNSLLSYLDASYNQLTGQLPTGLGTNSQLAYLDLSDNKLIGEIGVLEFSQLAQNLSILNLAKNNFTGGIPATMAMCNLLYLVDLSYNSLSGTVPFALANLSSLQTLHLHSNYLTGINPSIYSSWTHTLNSLDLSKNPWNAPLAAEIGSLTILQNLNLSYGGYTGSIPSNLGKLTQLESLDLSHNNFTGEVPSELGELMTSLISVNISFNHLIGSLPPRWVRFLCANPNSFIGNPGLCLEYNTSSNLCINKTSLQKAKLSIGIILAMAMGIALALISIAAVFLWWHKHAKTSANSPPPNDIVVKNLTSTPLPFTFDEIMVATENLSDAYIIGRGGHGVVYKVVSTSNVVPIAVKKIEALNLSTALIHKSFWSEIETLGKAKHRNLVKLLGFMKWGEVGLLLYDYISNGDLHSALYKKEASRNEVNLTWKVRLHIAEGVAHGLSYLHHDYDPLIVHRDIKSSNVLLDDNLEAHISDFGLAKVLQASNVQPQSQQWLSTPNVSGTHGYIAPEVGYGTLVTPKLDVYSYGILLLELLTGRQPTDASFGETWHVATWVKESVFQNGGKMSDSILDPLIFDPTNLVEKNIILDVERIALLCTRKNPIDRPTMKNVANLLKNLSQKMEAMNENEDNEGEGSSSQQNDVGILPIQVLKE